MERIVRTKTVINQRRVSYARMGELYRAMECRPLIGDAPVTFEDIEGLEGGFTFAQFIERNRGSVQLYEEAVCV